ncbi:MAG: helix-turn-helix transcriptional regulator [Deltaproteobacteria bacterium]|nr:helix-turn-helix transcriptional regulator [Deltaproteobacteria bacterium]
MTVFILNSLNKKPVSGYDLLKSISDKTDGNWTPSKGTVYPILKQLEKEKLIQVLMTCKRSKNIFELTPKGKESLRNIKECKKQSREKIFQFRNLLIDIFGEEKTTAHGLIFNIKNMIEDIPSKKEKQASKILENCLLDLKRIR